MKHIAIVLALLVPTSAVAQQSPMEQAMGAKLIAELGISLQCSADAIAIKAALDKALARVKELEAKGEPAEK